MTPAEFAAALAPALALTVAVLLRRRWWSSRRSAALRERREVMLDRYRATGAAITGEYLDELRRRGATLTADRLEDSANHAWQTWARAPVGTYLFSDPVLPGRVLVSGVLERSITADELAELAPKFPAPPPPATTSATSTWTAPAGVLDPSPVLSSTTGGLAPSALWEPAASSPWEFALWEFAAGGPWDPESKFPAITARDGAPDTPPVGGPQPAPDTDILPAYAPYAGAEALPDALRLLQGATLAAALGARLEASSLARPEGPVLAGVLRP